MKVNKFTSYDVLSGLQQEAAQVKDFAVWMLLLYDMSHTQIFASVIAYW